jgi:hypothetical protein
VWQTRSTWDTLGRISHLLTLGSVVHFRRIVGVILVVSTAAKALATECDELVSSETGIKSWLRGVEKARSHVREEGRQHNIMHGWMKVVVQHIRCHTTAWRKGAASIPDCGE